jgi:transposase
MRRTPVNTIKEVLRLKYLGKLSNRKIELLGLASKSAISNYTARFKRSGLSIDEALVMEEEALFAHFYPELRQNHQITSKPHPDWGYIHNELKDKKKGMTRQLLWEEYKEQHPDGYGISQFKEYYSRFTKTLNPSMRQVHYAGDKLFVDFSGLTMPIHNARTGEIHKAQIFVSVLGASGYTFVHAVMSQRTEDFIECHNEAFAFYGGAPNQIVPDNLKAAVISHKKGKVKLNESYADMGRHYGVAIVPARPYKPQDKSKVELGVKGIQRWILMRLRNHTFFDINELNDAIAGLIDAYNAKVIRRLGKSRRELFEALDKPALHPLRANRYVYREYKRYNVRSDYHIEIDGSGYSVPFTYLGKQVDVWYSRQSVTIAHRGEVIAIHPRLSRPYEDSTITEHMPKKYQYQFEKWNPGRILNWALTIGSHTTALMKQIMQSRSHPVRGYQSCMAILSFSKTYGNEALELACVKAIELGTHSVGSIESMLKRRTYLHEETAQPVNNLFNRHANIRGSAYYIETTT